MSTSVEDPHAEENELLGPRADDDVALVDGEAVLAVVQVRDGLPELQETLKGCVKVLLFFIISSLISAFCSNFIINCCFILDFAFVLPSSVSS